ncbi:MAG: pyridoxal phosphate-dependent aminotransferase [Gemmatimonadaceae bacterium]
MSPPPSIAPVAPSDAAFAPSSNVSALKESATIAASARAKALKAQGRRIIDLGAGEPDFETPAFIRDAAARAVDAGHTHYTATEGILPLRQAIASGANSAYKGTDAIDPRDIVVSNGSKQSLFNACFVLFGAGDEVLIPTPSWTSYYEMVSLAKARAVPVFGEATRSLKVTAAQLATAATSRTRGVMINSPCNPTGAVYTRDELSEILDIAEERGWWVLSDEIYARIAYEAPATTALEVARTRARLVVINGVAKAYAMTGWRIGWAIAPRAVAQAMTALQSHTTSNASSPSQHAAVAALTNEALADRAVGDMVNEFRERRDAATALLRKADIPFIDPAGAFYVYIDVSPFLPGESDPGTTIATRLIERRDVAVVPGAAFYTPAWIRVSYAAPRDQVVDGIERIIEEVNETRPAR